MRCEERGQAGHELSGACVPLTPAWCGRNGDCATGETCIAARGNDSLDLECGTVSTGSLLPLGAACTNDAECLNNLCYGDRCSAPCASVADCDSPVALECVRSIVHLDGGRVAVRLCVGGLPCDRNADCNSGTTCRVYRGDAELFTSCDPTGDLTVPLGTHCNVDSDCAANLCVNDECTSPCVNNSDCGADFECQSQTVDVARGPISADLCVAVEDEPPHDTTSCTTDANCDAGSTCDTCPPDPSCPTCAVCGPPVCVPRDGALRGTGIPCTDDSQCQSTICLDAADGGTCTELCVSSGDCWLNDHVCEQRTAGTPAIIVDVCVPPPPPQECTTNIDCAASGQVCGDIRFDWTAADQVQSYCISPVAGGGGLGDTCSGEFSPNVGCHDRICMADLSDQCSSTCSTDADCSQSASGFICSDVAYGARMRLCVDACTRDADCEGDPADPGDDLACALGRNETDDRYDFTCRLLGGTMPTGSNCAAVKDCDHGICLVRNEVSSGSTTEIESVCTQPCETDADCPSDDATWDWYCVQASFVRPVSGSAQPVRICSRAAQP